MNILFSDEFAEDFADLGNVATRQVLDMGTAGNQQHFWQRVASAFMEECNNYGQLCFLDDNVLMDYSHINPAIIVPHAWKKLRTIWKSINSEYKTAMTKFTQSGTHDNNFFSFCNGKVDTFYLRKHLELRPNLNATVEADLPEECALSSNGMTTLVSMNSSVTTTGSGRSMKKRTAKRNDVSEALQQYHSNTYNSELVQKKIEQLKYNSELARKQIVQMENEEERRAKQEVRLDEEHQHKKRKAVFDEWSRTREAIKTMRQELLDVSLSIEAQNELLEDIERLVRRKNSLALDLGMN